MNATITLLIHWSIAIGLIIGGITALIKGFELVKSGKGKTKEESSIEFLWLKVKVKSLGALVMLTAFMWGLAAVRALPNYKDPFVEICTTNARNEINKSIEEIAHLEKKHANIINENINLKEVLSEATSNLNYSQIALEYKDRQNIHFNNFVAGMAQQREAYQELEKAIQHGDKKSISENSLKLKKATETVKMSVQGKL